MTLAGCLAVLALGWLSFVLAVDYADRRAGAYGPHCAGKE